MPAVPPLTVTVPVYVLAERLPTVAPMVRVPELVPEAGETVSQDSLLEAVQVAVPLPLLETLTVWVGGLEPPAVAEKLSDEDDTVTAGGAAAATVRVTETVWGVLPAPGAFTVTVPV